MEPISADDEGIRHEAPPPQLAAPAVLYEGLPDPAALYIGLEPTAEPSAFSVAVASPDHDETLKPADVPDGHGGGLPPSVPFRKSTTCMAMACCCCCSSFVILLGITLGIVLPILALLSTAQVSAPSGLHL